MKQDGTYQLKIIMTYDVKGGVAGPIRKTIVYHDIGSADASIVSLDGSTVRYLEGNIQSCSPMNAVGCISSLRLQADCDTVIPLVEFVFPDLHDPNIDEVPNRGRYMSVLSNQVDHQIEMLSNIPGVDVIVSRLDPTIPVVMVQEIGTEGYIDSIAMKRRRENDQ